MLTQREFDDLDELLEGADGHPDLTDWEVDFVTDMIENLDLYGRNLTITPKQQEVLDRIEEIVEW